VIDRNTPEYAAIVAVLDDGEMAMRRPDSQETADLIVSALDALSEATPSDRSVFWDETAHIVKGGRLSEATPGSDPALDVDRLDAAIRVAWNAGHSDLRSGLTTDPQDARLSAAIAAEYNR
jgi:hypothetical protein